MRLEEYVEGTEYPLESVEITAEDIEKFARWLDPLPNHLDAEKAAKSRFGGIISPGRYTFAAVWLKWLEKPMFYEDVIAGVSLTTNFKAPVYAGDVLTGVIRVEKVEPRRENDGLLTLSLTVHNQDGKLVLTSTIVSLVNR